MNKKKSVNHKAAGLDCSDFIQGRCTGNCDGMGHYICDVCKYRKPKYKRYTDDKFLYFKNAK